MSRTGKLIWVPLLMLSVLGAPLGWAQDHSHAEHGQDNQLELELDQGEKWATDGPLRQGMEGIRTDLNEQLDAIHNRELTGPEYAALADSVDAQVQYMFDNCELPPAADAQLHVLLARIMQASEQMRHEGQPREGAIKLVGALEAYADHFEHGSWKGLSR